MASSRNIRVNVAVAFIFYLMILPSKSVGLKLFSGYSEDLEQRKMVLGSRPPGCVNKCSGCRPCKATLVAPPHQRKAFTASSSHREDDTYYLLSWKCRCGNKLYQP